MVKTTTEQMAELRRALGNLVEVSRRELNYHLVCARGWLWWKVWTRAQVTVVVFWRTFRQELWGALGEPERGALPCGDRSGALSREMAQAWIQEGFDHPRRFRPAIEFEEMLDHLDRPVIDEVGFTDADILRLDARWTDFWTRVGIEQSQRLADQVDAEFSGRQCPDQSCPCHNVRELGLRPPGDTVEELPPRQDWTSDACQAGEHGECSGLYLDCRCSCHIPARSFIDEAVFKRRFGELVQEIEGIESRRLADQMDAELHAPIAIVEAVDLVEEDGGPEIDVPGHVCWDHREGLKKATMEPPWRCGLCGRPVSGPPTHEPPQEPLPHRCQDFQVSTSRGWECSRCGPSQERKG